MPVTCSYLYVALFWHHLPTMNPFFVQFQLKVPAHKAEALARQALEHAPDGVNVDAVLRVQGSAFNEALAAARQASEIASPGRGALRLGASPRRIMRPGASALGSPKRLESVTSPATSSSSTALRPGESSSPSAAAFFAAADHTSPAASHAGAVGSGHIASHSAPVAGAASPTRPHGLRALVLPGHHDTPHHSPGGPGGLLSPLDALPTRKHQLLHPPADIWGDLVKTKALAEEADEQVGDASLDISDGPPS